MQNKAGSVNSTKGHFQSFVVVVVVVWEAAHMFLVFKLPNAMCSLRELELSFAWDREIELFPIKCGDVLSK